MLFDLAAWVVIILVGWAVGRGGFALLRVDGQPFLVRDVPPITRGG